MWFQILSELFVNFAAAWFAVVIVEPQITGVQNFTDILGLILKFVLGILSLVIAKYLRERKN